jgi:predicted nucleic acid-binding protein
MEKLFIDSNILIHATNPQSPQHEVARAVFKKYLQSETELFVSSQVLREYASVMTGKAALNVADAQKNIEQFTQGMMLLHDSPESFALWREFVQRYDVKGRNIHDCNIAATMAANGVTSILTHNGRDFTRYSEITVIPL